MHMLGFILSLFIYVKKAVIYEPSVFVIETERKNELIVSCIVLYMCSYIRVRECSHRGVDLITIRSSLGTLGAYVIRIC